MDDVLEGYFEISERIWATHIPKTTRRWISGWSKVTSSEAEKRLMPSSGSSSLYLAPIWTNHEDGIELRAELKSWRGSHGLGKV